METQIELKVDDLLALFAYNKWDAIRTEAENAWLEGANADANPYNQKTDFLKWSVWNKRWCDCNKYC